MASTMQKKGSQQPLSQSQKLQMLMERAIEKKLLEWTENVLPEILNETLAQFFPDQAVLQEQMTTLQQALGALQRMGAGPMKQGQQRSAFTAIRQAQSQQNYKNSRYGDRGVPKQIQKEVYNVNSGLDETGIIGSPGMGDFMEEEQAAPRMMSSQPVQGLGGVSVEDLVSDTEFSAEEFVQMQRDEQMAQYQTQMMQQGGGQMPMQQHGYGQQQPQMMHNPYMTSSDIPTVNAEEFARSHTMRDYADPQEVMNGYNAIATRANQEAAKRQQQQ